jgi:hypothetical protein
MSNIPKARLIFQQALTDLQRGMRKLKTAERLLVRDAPVRRAKRGAVRCTPEMAQRIRDYARAHPTASYHKISILFGVNGGRVSEAIRNLR